MAGPLSQISLFDFPEPEDPKKETPLPEADAPGEPPAVEPPTPASAAATPPLLVPAGADYPAEEEEAPIAPTLAAGPEPLTPEGVEVLPQLPRPVFSFDFEPVASTMAEPERSFLSGRPLAPIAPEAPKSTRGRKSTKVSEAGPDKVLVPEDEVLFQKQYYGISEVAAMFGVNISMIRYWENEFPQLKPRKNGKGDRLFRPEDIKTLVLIYDLVRRRKFTLEGAKEFLKKGAAVDERFALIRQLQKMRLFLQELKANL